MHDDNNPEITALDLPDGFPKPHGCTIPDLVDILNGDPDLRAEAWATIRAGNRPD